MALSGFQVLLSDPECPLIICCRALDDEGRSSVFRVFHDASTDGLATELTDDVQESKASVFHDSSVRVSAVGFRTDT